MPAPPPGLCGACRHAREIRTARGSTFRLCERSATDPRYARYPVLPKLACAGYEPPLTRDTDGSGGPGAVTGDA